MKKLNRRNIFKLGLYNIGFLGIMNVARAACSISVPTSGKAFKKLLKPDGRIAKRLKFVSNAENSKIKKSENDHCGICKFFNVKKEDQGYAPCAFASNKYVPRCGHCKQFKLDKKKI